MSKCLLLLTFFVITGCQTGIFIKESPAALTDIRKAVVTILGQPKVTSQNGRELISDYHDKKGHVDSALAKAKNRYYTIVTILGERRPYDIKVEVFQEAKTEDFTYEVIAEDVDLAQKLANQIETALNESLKNRNVIDDFKAF
jgi:hypothetical protein